MHPSTRGLQAVGTPMYFYQGLYHVHHPDGSEGLGNVLGSRGFVVTFRYTPPFPRRPCHSAIHRTYDNKTLAAQYHTLELLMQVRSLGISIGQIVMVKPRSIRWRGTTCVLLTCCAAHTKEGRGLTTGRQWHRT